MRNDQFYGIYFGILIIVMILQWHMMSICDYLKEIKKLLEKQVNQESSKGEKTMLFADIDEIIDCTPDEKSQTNADRIRAMSDEKLATIIDAFNTYFDWCNRSDDIDCHDCELHELCHVIKGDAINWLKKTI